jgi:phospholipid/cholesterol/gamma-HCH transport system permease protein
MTAGPDSIPPPSQSRLTDPGRPSLMALNAFRLSQRSFASRAADRILGLVVHTGQMAEMTLGTARAAFRRPFEGRAIISQLEALGVASLGIVVVTSVFIGMVMSVQFAFGLRKFGGMEYTGRVIGLSFSRELAPTLTAVIVGGRIGAGMAAEVGAMSVTEQIDAIRALGADPFKKLVLPRLVASIIVMPILAGFALIVGFSGAMLVTDMQFGIPAAFFLNSALDAVTMADFVSGMFKTPFFGAIIALVGCHFGLHTQGGTAGVGNATTRTVVVISITILIADFFLTKLGIAVFPFF